MNLIVRIKKRSNSEWITLFVLAMPFLFGLLIDLIGLPTFVKYVIDIAGYRLSIQGLNALASIRICYSKLLLPSLQLFPQ